jgi:hypothetical protein
MVSHPSSLLARSAPMLPGVKELTMRRYDLTGSLRTSALCALGTPAAETLYIGDSLICGR